MSDTTEAPEAFNDGIVSLTNELLNRRSAVADNTIAAKRLNITEMRAAWRTGLASKIYRIKTWGALDDTLHFESTADELYYSAKLENDVNSACQFMLGFGRGIIVLHKLGDDLTQPLRHLTRENAIIKVFSGDMVTVSQVSRDLSSDRYYKPLSYQVRGQSIHWTRVVDFTYVKPVEEEASLYQYGGISEAELIWPQMVNDGVVERATGTIIDKSSTFIHQVKGLNDLIQRKQESHVVRYVSTAAATRSGVGTYLADAEDTISTLSQSLGNLSDVNDITLQRLALVTGLAKAKLVGDPVKGLSNTDETAEKTSQETYESIQKAYLRNPLNELAAKLGMGRITFKENQNQTPLNQVEFDTKAIANAAQLEMIGEDGMEYLNRYDVTKKEDYDAFFGPTE